MTAAGIQAQAGGEMTGRQTPGIRRIAAGGPESCVISDILRARGQGSCRDPQPSSRDRDAQVGRCHVVEGIRNLHRERKCSTLRRRARYHPGSAKRQPWRQR